MFQTQTLSNESLAEWLGVTPTDAFQLVDGSVLTIGHSLTHWHIVVTTTDGLYLEGYDYPVVNSLDIMLAHANRIAQRRSNGVQLAGAA